MIVGLILAGGEARRMGGGDKPLRLLAGRPLLAHVVGRLGPQCDRLAISANGDPARFAAFGLTVLPDTHPGRAGPLAGILAGLEHAMSTGAVAVVSCPGDTPFVPLDLVARLSAARAAAGADLATAASGGRDHPAVGLWPASLRDDLRRVLTEAADGSVTRFADRHRRARAEWPARPHDRFFNVNTPADLAEAERLWVGRSPG